MIKKILCKLIGHEWRKMAYTNGDQYEVWECQRCGEKKVFLIDKNWRYK